MKRQFFYFVLFFAGLFLVKAAFSDSLPEEAPKCVRLCPSPEKAKPSTPKPRPRTVVKTVVKEVPAQKSGDVEQEQKQNQNVNIHIHNEAPKNSCGCKVGRCSRANFKAGVHVGCGPVGVKSVYVDPTTLNYTLKSGLVVGGSLSARILGPAWLTGMAFSNGLVTGGLELEF